MTKQKQKLFKAKIAAALYHEEGRVPTTAEIEKWTKFAKVLYTAVLGLHFGEGGAEEGWATGDLLTPKVTPIFFNDVYDLRIYPGFNRQAEHGKPAV